MQRITLPDELAARVAAVDESAELCDETGQPRGVVVPVDLFREMHAAWLDSQFDPVRLEQARNEPGGLTTAEAIQFIKDLEAKLRGATA